MCAALADARECNEYNVMCNVCVTSVIAGIKGDVRASAGARRRRISSDSSNSSSLDADIFQKLFLDKSVDDDLLNLNEGAGSKSRSRRHLSPSSSDESNDALDALFNRKLGKPKPNKRRERYDSFDSVDDLGKFGKMLKFPFPGICKIPPQAKP